MKTHYVPRQMWDAVLFTDAACSHHVETHKYPKWVKAGSTYHKNQVKCGNCRRTKVFRGVK